MTLLTQACFAAPLCEEASSRQARKPFASPLRDEG